MDKEKQTLLRTKVRNLERKYAKIKVHPELCEETIELKAKIDALKMELAME